MKSEIPGVNIRKLDMYVDGRGWLMELFRDDCLNDEHLPAMAYVSMTEVGKSRGAHVHFKQTDNFCFFSGELILHLWWGGLHELFMVGVNNPVSIIVPPGVVHGYKNIGNSPAMIINMPNQLYAGTGKRYSVDEMRYEENPEYQM